MKEEGPDASGSQHSVRRPIKLSLENSWKEKETTQGRAAFSVQLDGTTKHSGTNDVRVASDRIGRSQPLPMGTAQEVRHAHTHRGL